MTRRGIYRKRQLNGGLPRPEPSPGTGTKHQITSTSLQMLDLLLEFFADDARWMQGHYHDGARHCLIGALDHLQRNHHIPYAGAVYFLQQALPSRQSGLVNFNDRLCASLPELRSVIRKARTFALEDAEGAFAAAAMERKLLAEVECYRAAKVSMSPSGLTPTLDAHD